MLAEPVRNTSKYLRDLRCDYTGLSDAFDKAYTTTPKRTGNTLTQSVMTTPAHEIRIRICMVSHSHPILARCSGGAPKQG